MGCMAYLRPRDFFGLCNTYTEFRMRAGTFGPVRTFGAIPPTARPPHQSEIAGDPGRRRVPPVHEATGGYAVRRPPPIRLYSASSFFSLFLVWAMIVLIFCLVTIWISVLNPALSCTFFGAIFTKNRTIFSAKYYICKKISSYGTAIQYFPPQTLPDPDGLCQRIP